MNRLASLVQLVVGLALLAMGWDAHQSASSKVSRLFTGASTDRTIALLVGGGLLAATGLGGFARGPKQ